MNKLWLNGGIFVGPQAALEHRNNPCEGHCCQGYGGGNAQKGWNKDDDDENDMVKEEKFSDES